jgi:hypothetical protein
MARVRRLWREDHRAREIVSAIRRGIEATERSAEALLDFITAKEVAVSKFK